jgi:NAD(P)-dependent dehydrogenase (short-subunit alcohol dehydrogenase family)
VKAAYCNSKLANMLDNVELLKRIKGSGVDSFALSPGFAYTKLFRYTPVPWYHYIHLFAICIAFHADTISGIVVLLLLLMIGDGYGY